MKMGCTRTIPGQKLMSKDWARFCEMKPRQTQEIWPATGMTSDSHSPNIPNIQQSRFSWGVIDHISPACLLRPYIYFIYIVTLLLGSWFKYFLFSTPTWEMIQLDEHIFRVGWNHLDDHRVGCSLLRAVSCRPGKGFALALFFREHSREVFDDGGRMLSGLERSVPLRIVVNGVTWGPYKWLEMNR